MRRGAIAGVVVLVMVVVAILIPYTSIVRRERALDRTLPAVTLSGPATAAPGQTVEYLVQIRNLVTGLPCARAWVEPRIHCSDSEGRVDLARVTMDETGRGRLRISWEKDLPPGKYDITAFNGFCDDSPIAFAEHSVLITEAATEQKSQASDGPSQAEGPRGDPSSLTWLTTDKPIYQPGQRIAFRTMSTVPPSNVPFAGAPVTFEIEDAQGNRVMRKRAVTSEFGFASGEFEIADQAPVGSYKVTAVVGGDRTTRTVRVERYVLPRFRLDLTTDTSVARPGAKVHGEVNALYTFGEPVAKAKVKLHLDDPSGGGALFEGLTDSAGHVAFTITLPAVTGQRELIAEVVAASGDAQRKSIGIHVSPKAVPVEIDVVPESSYLAPGLGNFLFIETRIPETNQPVRAHLQLEPSSVEADTDDEGFARVPWTPTGNDGKVSVRARTPSGEEHTASFEFKVAEKGMILRTDKTLYLPGEVLTADVTILPAESGDVDFALVPATGGFARHIRTKVDHGTARAAFTVPPNAHGRLDLWAKGPTSHYASRVLAVAGRALALEFVPDKPVYAPGDMANIGLRVMPSPKAASPGLGGAVGPGAPSRTAVGLWAVDDAVHALAGGPDPDTMRFAILNGFLNPTGKWERYNSWGRLDSFAVSKEELATFASLYDDRASEPRRARLLAKVATLVGTFECWRDNSWAAYVVVGKFLDHKEVVLESCVLSPVALGGLLLLAVVALSLVRVVRPPAPFEATEDERRTWKRAMRLMAVFFYVSIGAALALAYRLSIRVWSDAWWVKLFRGPDFLALLILLAAFSLAAVFVQTARLRRLRIARRDPVFRNVVLGLPLVPLLVCIYAGLQFGLLPKTSPREPFNHVEWFYVCELGLLGLVQLVMGALSVIQNAPLVPSTARARLWTFATRACLTGAPITLAVIGGLIYAIAFPPSLASQVRASQEEEAARMRAYRGSSEGGMGARGAEGSAGRPPDRRAIDDESASEPRLRREFPEVLFWLPETVTAADGTTTLRVPLADSITTWRLHGVALDGSGRFGSGGAALRVFQDFFVEPVVPNVLTRGDEVTVPIAVFNYLDAPQTIHFTIESSPGLHYVVNPLGKGARRNEFAMSLKAREVSSHPVRIVADAVGVQWLRVKASGSSLADAVERTIRVEPEGQKVEQVVNDVVDGDRALSFTVPANAVPGSAGLFLKAYRGVTSQLAEALEGVFQAPYGCFEQTSSTTYPSILALELLTRQNRANAQIEKKATNYIGLGYQRLLSFEVSGGGFDWYGRAPANVILTAYGLMEFTDMARVFPVEDRVIERTRAWLLSKQSSDGTWVDPSSRSDRLVRSGYSGTPQTTAYVAWALAASGERGPALDRALDYVVSVKDDIATTPYVLALRIHALLAGGRTAEGEALASKLIASMTPDLEGTRWSDDGTGNTYSRGMSLAEETTALAAHALFRLEIRRDMARDAVAWLRKRRNPQGVWSTTQATVWALRALLDDAHPESSTADAAIDIEVNGEPSGHVRFTGENSDLHQSVDLREHLRPGENRVRLLSSSPIGYQLIGTHNLPWQGQRAKPSPLELTVDCPARFVAPARRGECQVTLNWKRHDRLPMVVAELGVPPTFAPDIESLDALVHRGVIDRYTLEPRYVTIYLRELRSYVPVTFPFILRGSHPAKVAVPPARAWAYYEPSIRASVRPSIVTAL